MDLKSEKGRRVVDNNGCCPWHWSLADDEEDYKDVVRSCRQKIRRAKPN